MKVLLRVSRWVQQKHYINKQKIDFLADKVNPEMLVGDLVSLSASLFGLDPASTSLALNSQLLRNEMTLASAGVVDSDLLLLVVVPAPQRSPMPNAMSLDFSSILGGISSAGRGSTMSTGAGGSAGGLNLIPPQLTRANSTAVEWAGMSLDDVFSNNRNPQHIASIIRSHPNVKNEIKYLIYAYLLLLFTYRLIFWPAYQSGQFSSVCCAGVQGIKLSQSGSRRKAAEGHRRRGYCSDARSHSRDLSAVIHGRIR